MQFTLITYRVNCQNDGAGKTSNFPPSACKLQRYKEYLEQSTYGIEYDPRTQLHRYKREKRQVERKKGVILTFCNS